MLLGTWNLENLYRPGSPYGPQDEAGYESKLAALAAVIRSSIRPCSACRRSGTRRP